MVYAEINTDGKCYAVSDFGDSTAEKDTLIPLESYDTSVLGKIWTGSEWVEDTTPEPEPIEPDYVPTNAEIYENQLIIMSALADIAEMAMEV